MIEQIKKTISPQIGSKNVGAVIAIYEKGKETYLSFGETVLGNNIRPDADTLFEIGSITKLLTGLMLARLIDLKKVSIKDPLSRFIPESKNQSTGAITLEELVTHTSGLPRLPCNLHYASSENPYADYSEKDLIEGLRDSSFSNTCRLEKHPTQNVNYSNWGFGLLGYALARFQKSSYESLLRELVLEPLGLKATMIIVAKEFEPRRAQGYTNELKANPYWYHQTTQGAGAVVSSVRDMLQFARALLHPEETKLHSALKLSVAPLYKSDPNDIAYAWFVRPSGNYWHDGMTGGFSSLIKIYPKEDRAVVYLSNTARDLEGVLEAVEN